MKRLRWAIVVASTVVGTLVGAWWLGESRTEAQRCCRTCPAAERDGRGCCPERYCDRPPPPPVEREPSKRVSVRRASCEEGEHRSAGHCCPLGAEWVPGRGECVCLDPGVCGPRPPPSTLPVTPTPTPGSVRGPSCPEGMVSIPGGTFEMGSSFGGEADERPVTRVTLSGYCLDRTEVTVRAYAQCVSAGSCQAQDSVSWSGITEEQRRQFNPTCNFRHSDRGEHPMNCVDWTQADAYCRWRGGRLPTEAEWEYAARGTDGRTYPWGNQAPGSRLLNACDASCRRAFPNFFVMFESDDGWATTAPVGSYPSGASPFGVQDMAGNVWEWVSDWYGTYPGGSTSNPRGAYQGSSRVNRGGGWGSVVPSWVRAADRGGVGQANRDNILGFRCARGGS